MQLLFVRKREQEKQYFVSQIILDGSIFSALEQPKVELRGVDNSVEKRKKNSLKP